MCRFIWLVTSGLKFTFLFPLPSVVSLLKEVVCFRELKDSIRQTILLDPFFGDCNRLCRGERYGWGFPLWKTCRRVFYAYDLQKWRLAKVWPMYLESSYCTPIPLLLTYMWCASGVNCLPWCLIVYEVLLLPDQSLYWLAWPDEKKKLARFAKVALGRSLEDFNTWAPVCNIR